MTTWTIDSTHSSIGFSVRHMMFAKVRGRFAAWTGEAELDLANLTASKVRATIDVASIDTGEAQRDGHLRSADFFDAENHPKLTFTSTKIEKKSDTQFALHGTLTIRGVDKPVVLDAELTGRGKDPWGGDRVGFHLEGKLNRKDWGLGWNQVLEAGGVLVGETVELDIELQVKASG
jgi:polyisoprenoid-binding protein YceI